MEIRVVLVLSVFLIFFWIGFNFYIFCLYILVSFFVLLSFYYVLVYFILLQKNYYIIIQYFEILITFLKLIAEATINFYLV